MEANVYRNLMRVFFQYQADTLLCIENNVVTGSVDKRVIEELMSDLSHSKTASEIPIQKIYAPEEALEILLHRGIITGGQKVLPVVDGTGGFVALWSKTEILGSAVSFQNSPAQNAPANEGEESGLKEKNENKFVKEFIAENFKPAVVAPVKPEVRFQISSSLENNVKNQAARYAQNSQVENRENSKLNDVDYVSIKTLEALPIPMLALDTKGEVLFYNQDWVSLQQLNKETLGVKRLMRITRDIMAKLAFDGKLEIDSVLNVPGSPPDFSVKMRSILGDHEVRARVIGYIFWIEYNNAGNSVSPENGADTPPEIKPQNTVTGKTGYSQNQGHHDQAKNPDYSGKTLIELLEIEEKKIIQWAMDETGHNQSNAAMLLGIPRQTFSYRFHRLFDRDTTELSPAKSLKKSAKTPSKKPVSKKK